MSGNKYITKKELPALPEPAINLINKGFSSLWQIRPLTLPDGSEAIYLFRLNKTDFRYLNSQGSPLSIKPDNIGNLEIISCLRFEDYEDKTEKLLKNLFAKT